MGPSVGPSVLNARRYTNLLFIKGKETAVILFISIAWRIYHDTTMIRSWFKDMMNLKRCVKKCDCKKYVEKEGGDSEVRHSISRVITILGKTQFNSKQSYSPLELSFDNLSFRIAEIVFPPFFFPKSNWFSSIAWKVDFPDLSISCRLGVDWSNSDFLFFHDHSKWK